ncbi:MAG: F0F1 ATP synthase subunit epsilon [Clostridiales bacterium]|nr:F0F1 ATP synthase subunit epsilon [Clostridiales bacterium]
MKTFDLSISSPDGTMFEGQAASLSVRGIQGDLAVLPGHIPFVTALKPCDAVIVLPDGKSKTGRIEGGILTVGQEKTTLLTGSIQWS